jgi:AraC-like DNA-binding protein
MDCLDRLAQSVAASHAAHGGGQGERASAIDHLKVVRFDQAAAMMPTVYSPVLCLVARGRKTISWGERQSSVQAGESFLVTLDIPVIGQIEQATPEQPYLAAAVVLDPAVLVDMICDLAPLPHGDGAQSRAIRTAPADGRLLETVLRLFALESDDQACRMVAPLLLRELYGWLLLGPHGPSLRAMVAPDGKSPRIARAVAHIRQNYRQTLRAADLAAVAVMGLSGFYDTFRAVTGMTPLAYQKHLRLMEARRTLLAQGLSAAEAAYEVGYASPSQFSRDYSRLFGLPPGQDRARHDSAKEKR